jgi:4-hydroxybenzoate polyprenyltransferase
LPIQKISYPMANSSAADRRKYWMYFLVSLVIFLLMLIFMNQWFWVAMPFMLTFLVMALGYM